MSRESDLQAGSILADMYKHICINNPPIEKSSFINAEIAKNNHQLVYHDEGYVCQYITFVRFAESVGVKAELPAIVHLINLSRVRKVIKIKEQLKLNHGKIGILGLLYKPNTPILKGFQSIMLAKELSSVAMLSIYDH